MGDFATTVFTGIVIAASSAWITVQLSLRRFRTEKLWEKRVHAYERVIDALHHFKAFSDAHIEAEAEGKELPDDYDKDLRAKARSAHQEIARATDVGAFLLGDEAMARLREFQKASRDAANTHSWMDYLCQDQHATSSCLEDMITLAKRDLKTQLS